MMVCCCFAAVLLLFFTVFLLKMANLTVVPSARGLHGGCTGVAPGDRM